MSKRLQVVVRDEELARFERAAAAKKLTLSEWVRQSLRQTGQDISVGDVSKKLAAIDRACAFSYPAPGHRPNA